MLTKTQLWIFFLSTTSFCYRNDEFRFSSIFSDHMVLQRETSTIWGYGPVGAKIRLDIYKAGFNILQFVNSMEINLPL